MSNSGLVSIMATDALWQTKPNIFGIDQQEWIKFSSCLDAYGDKEPNDPPDSMRVLQFYHLLKAAHRLPLGDYLELGTHRGQCLRVMYQFMDQTQRLYALDTFTGFDERDIVKEKQLYQNEYHAGYFSPTSAECVARYVGDGAPPLNLTVITGWFPQAFDPYLYKMWRFVHIDMDLYQPTVAALDILWSRMVIGGIILLHDYGCGAFPGIKLAVDQFCARMGIFPIELSDRFGSAVIRKSNVWRESMAQPWYRDAN